MKKIALFLITNFEETEAIATIDVLRRAGYQVDLISIENQPHVKGSHQIIINSEKILKHFSLKNYDGIVLPGGPGVDKMLEYEEIIKIVQQAYEEQKLIAAICAAPQVLGKAGILQGKKITHYPGCDLFMDQVIVDISQPTITDKNIITGASAGAAIQFALNIVKYFDGQQASEKLRKILVTNYK